MKRALLFMLAAAPLLLVAAPEVEPAGPRLLLAISSYRDRVRHPKVYFYEHDGWAGGKIVGSIESPDKRSDYWPSLSHEGRFCAFASEAEGQTGRIFCWDLRDRKLIDLPKLNDSPNAQMNPNLSGDGQLLTFTAWNRPGSSPRWDVLLYDVAGRKLAELPGLNAAASDERMPALDGSGQKLAFISNADGGAGFTDIYLYDRAAKKVIVVPELNSSYSEVEPSLSSDGRLLAFLSDRPGGLGGRDVYLFDLVEKKFLPLAGLNSVGQEQSPRLSPDGRFIVFVSERIGGDGERDVYLYDRQRQKLLETPELNSPRDDFDPCVIEITSRDR
jgi:Tol biopolymer transport system component